MPEFIEVPKQDVTYYVSGATAESGDYSPGDFMLVHHPKNFVSKLIRIGQRIRIHGEDRKHAYWNHAVMITSYDGEIVEALGAGITRGHISSYKDSEYLIVQTKADMVDRAQMMQFCKYVEGYRYGFLTILSIAFCTLTGGKFVFSLENQLICSGLVARCQERAGAVFSRNPAHIMPADLSKYYGVEPPQSSFFSLTEDQR